MNYFQNYALGVDYILEQGIVIWKITWKYSTRTYTEEVDLKDIDQSVLEVQTVEVPLDVRDPKAFLDKERRDKDGENVRPTPL